jgi:hypothetical protein
MRTARLAKLTLGIALASVLVGFTSLLCPGEPQTVVVYFNPTAAGTFNSTARVQTQTSIVNVPLTGRAISWGRSSYL